MVATDTTLVTAAYGGILYSFDQEFPSVAPTTSMPSVSPVTSSPVTSSPGTSSPVTSADLFNDNNEDEPWNPELVEELEDGMYDVGTGIVAGIVVVATSATIALSTVSSNAATATTTLTAQVVEETGDDVALEVSDSSKCQKRLMRFRAKMRNKWTKRGVASMTFGFKFLVFAMTIVGLLGFLSLQKTAHDLLQAPQLYVDNLEQGAIPVHPGSNLLEASGLIAIIEINSPFTDYCALQLRPCVEYKDLDLTTTVIYFQFVPSLNTVLLLLAFSLGMDVICFGFAMGVFLREFLQKKPLNNKYALYTSTGLSLINVALLILVFSSTKGVLSFESVAWMDDKLNIAGFATTKMEIVTDDSISYVASNPMLLESTPLNWLDANAKAVKSQIFNPTLILDTVFTLVDILGLLKNWYSLAPGRKETTRVSLGK